MRKTFLIATIVFTLIIHFEGCIHRYVQVKYIHSNPPEIDTTLVLPPAWAFGILYGGYTNQEETINRIKEIKAHQYPIDA